MISPRCKEPEPEPQAEEGEGSSLQQKLDNQLSTLRFMKEQGLPTVDLEAEIGSLRADMARESPDFMQSMRKTGGHLEQIQQQVP